MAWLTSTIRSDAAGTCCASHSASWSLVHFMGDVIGEAEAARN